MKRRYYANYNYEELFYSPSHGKKYSNKVSEIISNIYSMYNITCLEKICDYKEFECCTFIIAQIIDLSN